MEYFSIYIVSMKSAKGTYYEMFLEGDYEKVYNYAMSKTDRCIGIRQMTVGKVRE